MGIGQFNIGRDATLTIVRPGGAILRQTLITNFQAGQDVVELKSRPLNAPPLHRNIPDGWRGSFDYDRANSALDDYVAQMEAAFFAGGDSEALMIRQTIREISGAISQYRFDNVAIKLDDAGSWKADEIVKVKFSFMASTRTKVA